MCGLWFVPLSSDAPTNSIKFWGNSGRQLSWAGDCRQNVHFFVGSTQKKRLISLFLFEGLSR
ncbi:MAG: hypothetical protein A2445_01585 [Candidatus Jacksonbacteria bacterium RIFOXYC2_FULL_44_29]|nr:MAG: hypothetical protein A2240_00675 [Candidatus Jacksonbacteria bacterium RIFOXYA2_FULL_43_12]OGY77543.1 MAG: hypothetical protein A2295_05355 [Candidatus Jacksonbacteria bacterium RIFOXYB2_FULL_44_15]OGY79967.1 MAG: hypothetical protein A2550_05510 [Candidatus Jacksonbacteria bacterium RIFOXYD2_FULL_43_21]OGY80345.1 MAG: hypothetical protein A2445_01585 [Candidatus Jacksonbacteria bacterium RIFOXYC2_FULL_44_29]HBH45880.1 hypothetical protein [Candidatus Jacksonbacteria bacterium]